MSDQWRPEFLRAREDASRRRHYRERTPPDEHGAKEHARERARGRPMSHLDAFGADYSPSDPVREHALARARKIKALADRPGTPAEGKAARVALARFLKANALSAREL